MADNILDLEGLEAIKNKVLRGIRGRWINNPFLNYEYPFIGDFDFYIRRSRRNIFSDLPIKKRILLNKVDGDLDLKQIDAYVTEVLDIWGRENIGKNIWDVDQIDFSLEVESSQFKDYKVIGLIDISTDLFKDKKDYPEEKIDPAELAYTFDLPYAI